MACFRKTDWFLELYRRVAASSSEEYLAVRCHFERFCFLTVCQNNQSRVKYISEWMEVCNDFILLGNHAINLAVKFCIMLASWKDKHQDMYLYIQNANETLSVAKSSSMPAIFTYS